MKKLKKRKKTNPNMLEQYADIKSLPCPCVCYCGPGGYPWAQARDSLNRGNFMTS